MTESYGLVDFDIDAGDQRVELPQDRTGLGVILRSSGLDNQILDFRLLAGRDVPDAGLGVDDLIRQETREARAAAELRRYLAATPQPSPPPISVAICTKDRPEWLARLLNSLEPLRTETPFELLVVDNASENAGVRHVVEAAQDVRYVRESKIGLDFARNRALAEASGDVVAYLDDDTVVDAGWARGLFRAWAENPDAGCITGQVLPMMLDHPAQVLFERRGGFRRPFLPERYGSTAFADPLHPAGAGRFGVGANLSVDRRFVLGLGGFDEALDTGQPLPGGGDLDIFYRVLTGGCSLVYDPSFVVYHEHRADMAVLRRQYYTWGLGFFAFLSKSMRSDPERRPALRNMALWWIVWQARRIGGRLTGRDPTPLRMIWAEIWGSVKGVSGEYERSTARSAAIRKGAA